MAAGVDVVIVSYRCAGLLRECLGSVREHLHDGVGSSRTIVIDNASGDDTAALVGTEFPEVELVVNDSNRGFAAASNQGIRMGGAELVLLLNPDARIHDGTLDALIRALDSHPGAAAAGPLLSKPDGGMDHAAKRSFPTVAGALTYFTGIDRLWPGVRQYTAPEVARGPVDAINGAFMLIRRDALEEVGLFDEGYWMYMEDLDLCYRFKLAGRPVLYEPDATASHVKGGSVGGHRSPRLNVAFHCGMHRFYRKFYAPSRPALANAAVDLGIGLKLLLSLLVNGARSLAARIGRRGDYDSPSG